MQEKIYIVHHLSIFIFLLRKMYNERKYYGANKLFLDTHFIHANFSLYKNEYIVLIYI